MNNKNNNKCCKEEHLEYIESECAGETEIWYCKKCSKEYTIPVEYIRDFDNKELRYRTK